MIKVFFFRYMSDQIKDTSFTQLVDGDHTQRLAGTVGDGSVGKRKV